MSSTPPGKPAQQAEDRPERWLLGDGSLEARRVALAVTRVVPSAGQTDADRALAFDEWNVEVEHDNGKGQPFVTKLTFRLRDGMEEPWIRLVSDAHPTSARTLDELTAHLSGNALVKQVAEGVRRSAATLAEWPPHHSPLPSSAPAGSTIRASLQDVRLQVLAPSACHSAAVSSFLAEELSGKNVLGLAHCMLRAMRAAAQPVANALTPYQKALATRFNALDPKDPPDGYTYDDAVRALVEAGLTLAPFRVDEDPEDYVLDSLLYNACRNEDIDSMRALLLVGADPTERVRRSLHQPASSPFEYAARYGETAALGEMLEQTTPQCRQKMLDYLDRKFLHPNSRLRAKLLSEYPRAEATIAFATAYRARTAVQGVIAAVRDRNASPGGAK